MKQTTLPLIAISLLLPALSSAVTFDCSHIRTQDTRYNFQALGGPHSVSVVEQFPPSTHNTTWTIDLCGALKKTKEDDPKHQCPSGTYVCGIMRRYDKTLPDPKPEIDEVIPIAGSYATSTGKNLDPKYTTLESIPDSKTRGLRIELNGGSYKNKAQRAIIDMQCDPERTGNEERRRVRKAKRDDDDDSDKDDEDDDDKEGEGKSDGNLQFVSYGPEDSNDKLGTLHLTWRTKYACEGAAEDDNSSASKHWGGFTWFLIILFLGIAAYLIFGSWLNYNRYGARGWDLLPHSDSIRDAPYLFRDWSRRVVSTMQGGGGRGGYSAV